MIPSSPRAGLAYIALIVLGVLCLAVSCEEDDAGSSRCVPGESRLCHCSDGAAGSQICASDGKSLNPCECQGNTKTADAGAAAETPPTPVDTTKTVAAAPAPPATPVPPPPDPATLLPAPPPGAANDALATPFASDANTLALWHFDENTGQTTGDYGRHRLTTTLRATSWTAGRFGGALMFDGAVSNMQAPSNDGLFPTTNITIEAWFRPERAAEMTIYDVQDTQGLALRPRGNGVEVVFTLRIDNVVRTVASTTPATTQMWHHASGTFDGAMMRLWVDGQFQGELSAPGTLTRARSCETPTIGSNCQANAGWFHGGIDEVRLSDVARYVPDPSALAMADAGGDYDAGPDSGTTKRRTNRRRPDKVLRGFLKRGTRDAKRIFGIR